MLQGTAISVVSGCSPPEREVSILVGGVRQQQFRLAAIFNVLGEEEVAPEERSQKRG